MLVFDGKLHSDVTDGHQTPDTRHHTHTSDRQTGQRFRLPPTPPLSQGPRYSILGNYTELFNEAYGCWDFGFWRNSKNEEYEGRFYDEKSNEEMSMKHETISLYYPFRFWYYYFLIVAKKLDK